MARISVEAQLLKIKKQVEALQAKEKGLVCARTLLSPATFFSTGVMAVLTSLES